MVNNLVGTSRDQTLTFDYNTANQIIERTNSNSVYDYSAHTAFTDAYVANGQNQYTSVGGVTMNYDRRGNLTNDGSKTYTYDHSNRLKTVSGGISFQYDPGGRLYQQTVGSTSTQYLYDGLDLIAEYNGTTVLRRYVHGPGLDEPLVQYNGTGTTNRTFLIADERGSIVAGTNASGGEVYINRYDEYGKPQSGNQGLFQYTGQIYLSAAGLYHYKARAYDPELGRFLQTDPIGYAAGMNLYGYVSSDPMNLTDPFGLSPYDNPPPDPHGRSWLWLIHEMESALRFSDLYDRMYQDYFDSVGRWFMVRAQQTRERLIERTIEYNRSVSSSGAPDVQERTWSSYLPGTDAGANAAEYWANIAVNSDHPLAFLAHVPGVFAALWTKDTAVETAATLGTAGIGSAAHFARLGYYRYVGPNSNPASKWLLASRNSNPPYANMSAARDALYMPTAYRAVPVRWYKPVVGPRSVWRNPQWGRGGGREWYQGWRFPD